MLPTSLWLVLVCTQALGSGAKRVVGNSRLLRGFSKLSPRWAVGQPLLSLTNQSHSRFLPGSREAGWGNLKR